MPQTYSATTGNETLTVTEEFRNTRLTLENETGETSIVLNADEMRKLMGALGLFVEPYPGAWNKLDREAEG